MQTALLNIISDTKNITYHLQLKPNSNTQQHLTCPIISMYSNSPSNPQIHAATGRCAECLPVWPLSDCTCHDVLHCLFCSYGTVQEMLCVVTLWDSEWRM